VPRNFFLNIFSWFLKSQFLAIKTLDPGSLEKCCIRIQWIRIRNIGCKVSWPVCCQSHHMQCNVGTRKYLLLNVPPSAPSPHVWWPINHKHNPSEIQSSSNVYIPNPTKGKCQGGCDLKTVFRIRFGLCADLDPKIIYLNADPDPGFDITQEVKFILSKVFISFNILLTV
jgi:hypothetical protein